MKVNDQAEFSEYAKEVPGTLLVNGGRIVAKTMLAADTASGGPLYHSGVHGEFEVAIVIDFPSPEEAGFWLQVRIEMLLELGDVGMILHLARHI